MILLGSLKRQWILLLCINSICLIVLLFWLWLLVCDQDAFRISYPVSVLLVIYLDPSLRFLLLFPKAVVDRFCPKNIDEATKLCPFIENDQRVLSSQNTHDSLLWKSIKPCCHNQSSLLLQADILVCTFKRNLTAWPYIICVNISQIAPVSCPLAKMSADL